MIRLPGPKFRGDVSLEEAIKRRRSVRNFQKGQLSLEEISQLLWAAQGITDPKGYRSAPSAGALYPLEVYLVVGEVKGLESGVYKYENRNHGLIKIRGGDPASELYRAALMQDWVLRAQANLVFGAVFERTTSKYRERGFRYVYMEAGHAAQNVLLQAEALGLGGVVVGAFYDEQVKKALAMEEEPIYIISLGRR
ncbi:MAG: SagB/ThcOx family dehydrogenase [Desulfatiglandales bacterium]